MKIAIFRSETMTTYPVDSEGYHYSFAPIEYQAETDTQTECLMGSIYASGNEPHKFIEVPQGSQVAQGQYGEEFLYIPPCPEFTTGLAISAKEAIDVF